MGAWKCLQHSGHPHPVGQSLVLETRACRNLLTLKAVFKKAQVLMGCLDVDHGLKYPRLVVAMGHLGGVSSRLLTWQRQSRGRLCRTYQIGWNRSGAGSHIWRQSFRNCPGVPLSGHTPGPCSLLPHGWWAQAGASRRLRRLTVSTGQISRRWHWVLCFAPHEIASEGQGFMSFREVLARTARLRLSGALTEFMSHSLTSSLSEMAG